MTDCDHKWNSSREIRICLKCGQVRTFPANNGNGKIVWLGSEDKRIPNEVPNEDKKILATLAREEGVKIIAEYNGLPVRTLSAWTASYSKQKAKINPICVNHTASLPQYPNFSDQWETSVQLAWINTYLELVKLRSKENGQ